MAETVESTHNTNYTSYPFKRRISWGAIIAGVIVGLVIEITLALLGTAIGLTYIEPQTKDTSMSAAMKVSLFWWLITWLISLFLGSMVAAKLSGIWLKSASAMHGLTTWAVSVILTIMLLTSAVGSIVGGAFSLIGKSASAVSSAVSKVAPTIAQQAGQLLPQTNLGPIMQDVNDAVKDPEQRQKLTDAVKKLFTGESTEQNKQAVVDVLTQAGDMNEAEARQKVDSWEQSINKTKQQVKQAIPEVNEKAMQVAGKAADIGAAAAWFSFGMLVLGAIVSVIGGLIGTPCCLCDEKKDWGKTVRKVSEP
jgi:predicted RNA binding protein with dsRBD fold (UPF0201 family)